MGAPILYSLPQPQTGTGNFVRATSPTLVTPVLGAATATSLSVGAGAVNATAINFGTAGTGLYASDGPTTLIEFAVAGAQVGYWYGSGLQVLGQINVGNAILTSPSAAKWQLGQADIAAPVAQTLQTQSVLAGTSNTAGVSLTIGGSKGTGTGVGGAIVFQVATAGSTGTAQNALGTALTINSDKSVTAVSSVAVGGNLTATTGVFTGNASLLGSVGRGYFSYPSDGVLTATNTAGTDFGRLQLGGTTASFPALKRSTTAVQARLADDSAFTTLQGKLTTDAAATTGLTAGVLAAITNASITITDSTGQVYRVPCII